MSPNLKTKDLLAIILPSQVHQRRSGKDQPRPETDQKDLKTL
jgi:hypothetical protein